MPTLQNFASDDYVSDIIHALQFGIYKYGCVSSMPLHNHTVCEIGYVVHGKGCVFISNKKSEVSAGDILIIRSPDSHFETSEKNEAMEIIFLQVVPISPKSVLFERIFRKSMIVHTSRDEAFYEIVQDIIEEIMKTKSLSSLMIDLYTTKFFILLERLINKDDTFGHTPFKESIDMKNLHTISNINHFVRENICNAVTVEMVEKKLQLSRNALNTVLRKYNLPTIKKYILSCKIEKAKSMLAESDRDIAFISDILNFTDISHFYKTFKSQVFIPPLQYRKENQKSTENESLLHRLEPK